MMDKNWTTSKMMNDKFGFHASVKLNNKNIKWEREVKLIFSFITSFMKFPLNFASLSH